MLLLGRLRLLLLLLLLLLRMSLRGTTVRWHRGVWVGVRLGHLDGEGLPNDALLLHLVRMAVEVVLRSDRRWMYLRR